jgi:hypothetical protein
VPAEEATEATVQAANPAQQTKSILGKNRLLLAPRRVWIRRGTTLRAFPRQPAPLLRQG